MSFLEDYLWIIFAVLSFVLLLIFVWMLFEKKDKDEDVEEEKNLVYYGINKSENTKRKYILVTLLDFDRTKHEKIKLECIVHQSYISLAKLMKTKTRDSQQKLHLIDSKISVVRYPIYLLMEILPADIKRLENGEDVSTQYINQLKNLVFYTENIKEIKQFIQSR